MSIIPTVIGGNISVYRRYSDPIEGRQEDHVETISYEEAKKLIYDLESCILLSKEYERNQVAEKLKNAQNNYDIAVRALEAAKQKYKETYG